MSDIQPKLIVIDGPGTERVGPFFIDPNMPAPVTIGSGEDDDVRLPGPSVCSPHVRLHHRGEKWLVEALGPAGSVHVNGAAADGFCEIDDVDLLDIGPYKLQFLLEEIDLPDPRLPRRRRRVSNALQVPPAGAGAPPAAPASEAPARPAEAPPQPPVQGPTQQPPAQARPRRRAPAQGRPRQRPPAAKRPQPKRPQPKRPARPAQAGRDAATPPKRPPAAAAQKPGSRRTAAPPQSEPAGPPKKVCKCGHLLSPGPSGYACPLCKRQYPLGSDKAVVAPSHGSFFRSPTGLAVIGGAVVGLAAAGILLGWHFLGTPAKEQAKIEFQVGRALPEQTSKLLDVVIDSAVVRRVARRLGETKPRKTTLQAGVELVVKIEEKSHTFRVARAWPTQLSWKKLMPSLSGGLTGLAVEAVAETPLGAHRLEAGTILLRRSTGWCFAQENSGE